MGNDPTLRGVYVAVVVGVLYLLSHLKGRQRPDLGQFAAVFLASVAVIVSVDFGVETLGARSQCVAACRDQRLPMVLGAIAVAWISVTQVLKSFYRVLTYRVEEPAA